MLWGPGGRYRITTIVFWAVITDHNSIRRVLLCTTCHQPGHPAHRCPDIGKKVCSTRETTTLTTATLNLPAPSPFSHLLFPCIFRAGGASDDDSEMTCALGPGGRYRQHHHYRLLGCHHKPQLHRLLRLRHHRPPFSRHHGAQLRMPELDVDAANVIGLGTTYAPALAA